MTDRNIHEGRNIKRIREILGIKQDALAAELGLSQQAVSSLEQKEALDKDMLEKVAKVLKVPPEAIQRFSEEAIINYFSCTFQEAVTYNFNPFEKYIAVMEENKILYERLLKAERDINAVLERMVGKLENN